VGVLGHTTALIRVEENVVYEERGGYERLVVGRGYLDGTALRREGVHCPKTLINGTKVNVDTNLVVLESNEGKCETRVLAEPELERNVESGLGEGIARGANLARSVRLTRTIDVGEGRVRKVSELGGIANHRVVSLLLSSGHGELVPDVHPVAVVAIDALTTNLNLYLGNELLTWEIQPTGKDTLIIGLFEILSNLRESDLKNGVVGKVAVT
jgi:hypothetical protein